VRTKVVITQLVLSGRIISSDLSTTGQKRSPAQFEVPPYVKLFTFTAFGSIQQQTGKEAILGEDTPCYSTMVENIDVRLQRAGLCYSIFT